MADGGWHCCGTHKQKFIYIQLHVHANTGSRIKMRHALLETRLYAMHSSVSSMSLSSAGTDVYVPPVEAFEPSAVMAMESYKADLMNRFMADIDAFMQEKMALLHVDG